MNIIVAIVVGLKRASECIKMHHFEGDPIPTGEGDTVPFPRLHTRRRIRRLHSTPMIRVPRPSPDHIFSIRACR